MTIEFIMPIGHYAGTLLRDLPDAYLQTAARTFSDPEARLCYPDLAEAIAEELRRRQLQQGGQEA